MTARVERHQLLGDACRAGLGALGLGAVPTAPTHSANTLSAPRYPEGVTGADLLPKVRAAGVMLAGGLHPEIQSQYFRIGHMGATRPGDLLTTLGAIETALQGCGHEVELGRGVAQAQKVLARPTSTSG